MNESYTTVIGYEEDGTPVINCPVCEGMCFVEVDGSGILEPSLCPECNGNGDIAMVTIQ